MIVLDTNVISEVVKPSPAASVIEWLNRQQSSHLYVTTITLGEISYGVETLPDGNRRTSLANALDQFIAQAFHNRVLLFDRASAHEYGQVMAARRRLGRPLSAPDGQIAAVTRRHRFQLATRNLKDFEACGIGLINPFDA
jgi:predicted nucleic acid-binding protein